MLTEVGTAKVGERRLRLGMIGGGQGAYIGGIHRFAARLDGQYDLVAGAFDVDAARGHAFATGHYILPERSHDDCRTLIEAERQRRDCVDVVAVCMPNHTHFPIAKALLEARGREDLDRSTGLRTRTPPGHPEGYIEAFANLYGGFAEAIRARRDGRNPAGIGLNVPTGRDGLEGVAFVDAVVDCHEAGEPRWIKPAYA